jgi:type IV pilus assembly protein PilB
MSGRLGSILISQGVIDEDKLIAALSDQLAFGGKLGRTLVDLGYVSEEQLLRALAQQLGLDKVDLDNFRVEREALSCLAVDTCERYGVFPLRVDPQERVLWVATAEPDRESLQQVAQISQYTLEPVLASMSAIDRAVRKYYFGERMAPRPRLGDPLSEIPGDLPLAGPAPRSVPNPTADLDIPGAMVEPYSIGTVAPEGTQDLLQELRNAVVRLERTVTAQSRAFRALVDVLQEKGVMRRGELGQRTSKR